MNWKRSAAGVAVALPVFALLAFGMTRDPNQPVTSLPGQPAPDFALPVMDAPGDTARLADHAGNVVVVNFWASWCGPCRIEHPALTGAARRYAADGVQFFGVLYNDSPDNARTWLAGYGEPAYPTVLDDGFRTAIGYGLRGVPETVVIDREGTVVQKWFGPVTEAQLAAVIDPLVGR